MTTPAPRTPIRLGRGTKANLDTALAAADIKEGELVYAKDEDKLYMVEGGVFVEVGGVGAGGSGEGGGRGDGGDFNTGTVDSTFVLGVYGGGDFDTAGEDLPVELLNGDEGPDGGTF